MRVKCHQTPAIYEDFFLMATMTIFINTDLSTPALVADLQNFPEVVPYLSFMVLSLPF